MAKRSDAILQGSNVPLERSTYTLRITDVKFGESKGSGNPMITVGTEIVEPEVITLASGQQANIKGMKVPYYLTFGEKNLENTFLFFDRLGNPVEEINEEDPDIEWMNGKFFNAVLSSEAQFVMVKDPTTGKYVPVLDATGAKVSKGYQVRAQVADIIGECAAPGA